MKALKPWVHALVFASLLTSQFPVAAQPASPEVPQPPAKPSTNPIANLTPENTIIREDAFSTTRQTPDGAYQTVLSPVALNYQDHQGEWQAIDAQFQPEADSFSVEKNSIQTSVDNRRVWLSAVVGDTLIGWESLAFGAAGAGETFVPLAAPQADPPPTAYRRQENQALVYEQAWDDDALTEMLVSGPGSLEHLLILEQRPAQVDHAMKFLELRARLTLADTSLLLADGKPARAGQTARELKILDAQGQPVLQFEPVLAYEQADRLASVEGEYFLMAGETPGEWIVGMRTPWDWLSAPGRRFPVALDPTMTVLKSTGYIDGAAWISDQTDQYAFGSLMLGAYQPEYNSTSKGYFQFHDLPAILTQAPVKVTKATLTLSVSDIFIPEYYDSPTDWDELVIKRQGTLNYVGACPGDCGGFTLHDNTLENSSVYNWSNSPDGQAITQKPVQPVSYGPAKGKKKANSSIWDVTTEIKGWYDTYFTSQQNHWPVFRLVLNETCPGPLPYYFYADPFDYSKTVLTYKDVPKCTNFTIPPANIQLTIEYDVMPLALDANLLNKPGVPSSLEGVLENTDHVYQLDTYVPANTGGTFWRSVAVHGNHDYTPGPATTVSLRLTDTATQQDLGASSAQAADQTAALFIDDHAMSSLPGNPMTLSIQPSETNDFASDLQRNYRLEYRLAKLRPTVYGTWSVVSPPESFFSNELVKLVEFDINNGDTFLVKATTPPNVNVVLISPKPTTQLDEAVVAAPSARIMPVTPAEGGSGGITIASAPGGRWALAFINNGLPELCDAAHCEVPGGPTVLNVSAQMLACQQGSVATGDYGCQPVQLYDVGDANKEIDLPGTANDLEIYAEDPFVTVGAGWCTQAENHGTPIILRKSPGTDRVVIVANGRVCFDGSTLYLASKESTDPATSRAAVNIATPLVGSDPLNPKGKIGTNFLYGDPGKTSLSPGDKIGQMALDSTGGLVPVVNTLVGIQLFSEYWSQASLATNFYGIDTFDGKLKGDEQLLAQVSADVNQAALPAAWHVLWELFPVASPVVGDPAYTFNINTTQITALPAEIPMASMTLRLLNSSVPDGKLSTLQSWEKLTGPSAYQFLASTARITMDARLGEATQDIQAVVLPTGLARPPDAKSQCQDGGVLTSCLDVRGDTYAFNPVGTKDKPGTWSMPDVHITDSLGSVAFSQPGALSIYTSDHPLTPQGFAQAFSFDTWGAQVTVSSGACIPGGPLTTITKGKGYISLPGISSDASSDPGKWILVNFELCETNLREAKLTLKVEPGVIPVGSSGLGIGLIGGEITVGPDYTEVTIDVHFRSVDGNLLNDGEGSVTINTKGMFDLQGSGKLVGFVNANNLELQVAWNPLDILFEGDVSCCGNLIEGYMDMHGWFGKGWQDQYAWITDNDFHFTGSIGGRVGLEKGDLINKKFFKIPPFEIGFKTTISFGDFCTGTGCSGTEWGMSASISVFGYGAGVYVSASGPSIFLGSSSKKLVDQYGSSPKLPAAAENYTPVFSNPAAQFLTVGYKTSFDNEPTVSGSTCATADPAVYECSFSVPAGSGRALFIVTWLNGMLTPSLFKPDNTQVTPANAAANGVEIAAPPPAPDGRMVSFAATPLSGSTIQSGTWKVRLEPVAANTYFALTFAADPPAPSVTWVNPVLPGTAPGGGGVLNLQWNASRGGAALSDDVRAELFYAPVIQPQTFPGMVVTFPGDYQASAGLGANWDPGAPAILAGDDNGDGVWKLETNTLPAGQYQYKVALNGTWAVNYGLDGLRDGANITFTQVAANAPLSFYFDSSDNFITTHPQSDVIVLVGDMLSEIGGADWDPANLVGWMKPTGDASVFQRTLHLPAGNWNYKVALNESWAVNYGAGGVQDGANLPLVVPAGGALVRFSYDTGTHVITHTLLAGTSGAPVVGKLKANLGGYGWDTQGLASGEYQVGMRIADNIQSNGAVISWAPGTVVIHDTTPPPAPVYLSSKKMFDGLFVRWQRDDVTPDLAGYLIEYGLPDWSQTVALPKSLRVLPLPKSVNPLYQSARLGGLFGAMLATGDVTFCIHAYDASGNLSDCNQVSVEYLPLEDGPMGRVGGLAVFPTPTNLTATWTPPATTYTIAGYLVSYARTGCMLPGAVSTAAEDPAPWSNPGSRPRFPA